MKNRIRLIFFIVLLQSFISGCNSSDDDELNSSIVSADDTAAASIPVISEVTAVTTPNNDFTPNYIFSSTEAGTITYGGSCSSSTISALSGNNTITFNALGLGTYSNCTIRVTDSVGNISNTLPISSFVIDTTAPTVSSGVTSFYNSSDGINWSFGNSYAHPNIGLYGITFLD